jgi:uncharacterized protein YndB with AHSA1/START domain
MNTIEKGSFENKPHSKDLVLTRTYEAPRALVFDCLTKPEHLVHFWAPKPFTVPFCEIDLKVGGTWRYSMRSPDGWEHLCNAVYREIAPPGKLVMVSVVVEKGQKIFEIEQTFVLEEAGDKTKLKLNVKVLYAGEGCDPYLGGMEQGTGMTLDNLAEYLAKRSGAKS